MKFFVWLKYQKNAKKCKKTQKNYTNTHTYPICEMSIAWCIGFAYKFRHIRTRIKKTTKMQKTRLDFNRQRLCCFDCLDFWACTTCSLCGISGSANLIIMISCGITVTASVIASVTATVSDSAIVSVGVTAIASDSAAVSGTARITPAARL